MTIPTRALNDGTRLPLVGLGTYPHKGDAAATQVRTALDLGYRLIDTALRYENEDGVGRGIADADTPRDEIIVTTKVPGRHHGYNETKVAVAESLKNLGLERVDLVLIHWPLPRIDKYVDTWRALVDLQRDGVTTSIGVSNFLPDHLDRIIDATGVVPAVNQIELHPYLPQSDQRALHAKLGIATESWSPLGRGTGLLDDPVLARIAEAHDTTVGRVVLRWHLQHDAVPIPSSANPTRMAENLDLFERELTADDMAAIDALERGPIWGQDPATHEEF